MAINCATLPEPLLESELFGYAPGAFTGARKEGKKGLFELAHGGTLLLDEISELPLNLQSRLLRVIEEREVLPIGDGQIICNYLVLFKNNYRQGLARTLLYIMPWKSNTARSLPMT